MHDRHAERVCLHSNTCIVHGLLDWLQRTARGLLVNNGRRGCCVLLRSAQEDGTLKQLHDSWIVSPDAGCQDFSQVGLGLG